MKSYSFLPIAEKDVQQAVDYYEGCSKGLGKDFSLELKKSLQHITQYPYAWTNIRADIRRYIISRFPYAILYYVDDTNIVVIAVMNSKQEPNYWIDRI